MGILYERRNRVAYITINNPEKANTLDQTTMDELSQAWKDVWDDNDVRVAVITGSGDRHFSAGHNLASQQHLSQEERQQRAVEGIFWPASGTIRGTKIGADGRSGDHYPQIWKPVIAAVNGWAAGAGFYLILTSTDIRLACEEHARFHHTFTSKGWLGGGPGASRLIRQIAYADAMRVLLADEPFDAKEALRMHIINEMVPHEKLMSRAEEMAEGIAKLPPVAVRMMKEFLVRFKEVSMDEAWHVQQLMNSLLTQLTTDPAEGRQAFLDKRPPEFTGGLRYVEPPEA